MGPFLARQLSAIESESFLFLWSCKGEKGYKLSGKARTKGREGMERATCEILRCLHLSSAWSGVSRGNLPFWRTGVKRIQNNGV